MPYYTYILQSEKTGKYYIGSTGNLEDRLQRHNQGRSGYTKSGIPWKLVYKEEYSTRSDAAKREQAIKQRKDRQYVADLVRASRP